MVKFIQIVSAVDQITDCVPIVSTLKNGGIMLYQLVHKVNQSSPVKVSWKDDIKIYALSKNDFSAKVAAIPVFGNVIALVANVRNALGRGDFPEKDLIVKAIKQESFGNVERRNEIVNLYLARYPDQEESILVQQLQAANERLDSEIFDAIFKHRGAWSSNSLISLLKLRWSEQFPSMLIEKSKDRLTSKDADEILKWHIHTNYYTFDKRLAQQLKNAFPAMDLQNVGREIVANSERGRIPHITALLEVFPEVEEKYITEAMLSALQAGYTKVLDLFGERFPRLLGDRLAEALSFAVKERKKKDHNEMIEWLFSGYRISDEPIAKVLDEQLDQLYLSPNGLDVIKILAMKVPEVALEKMTLIMEKAARNNIASFRVFLNEFTQLRPEHLQGILHDAVHVYQERNSDVSYPRCQWKDVADSIREKFPEIVEDLYFQLDE